MKHQRSVISVLLEYKRQTHIILKTGSPYQSKNINNTTSVWKRNDKLKAETSS